MSLAIPFTSFGAPAKEAASTTVASGALACAGGDVRVVHPGSALAYIAFSTSAAAAEAIVEAGNGLTMLGPSVEVFGIPSMTHYAVKLASGTATVEFTSGRGA